MSKKQPQAQAAAPAEQTAPAADTVALPVVDQKPDAAAQAEAAAAAAAAQAEAERLAAEQATAGSKVATAYLAAQDLKHAGKRYAPGDEVPLSDEDAERLIVAGIVIAKA